MEVKIQVLAIFMLLCFGKHAFSTPPHIIFMLIDDLGWNDVSFHGSLQIPTPNIDALAYSGIILNNYYVQPLCTPSRGSLMTGKYPIRLGLQHYVIGCGEPWGLSPKETLLPQYLKKFGYITHAVGKWHLGYFKDSYLPTNRGFDSFFGYYEGKGDFFTHFDVEGGFSGLDLSENGRPVWNYTGYYSTELFTEKAKTVIKTHNLSKPLFLYLSHQAVHAGNAYDPLQAPEKYVDKFSYIKDLKRRKFAGIVSALDQSVGEIFLALEEKDMLKNSIIVFSTDNGGAVQGIDLSSGSNWPLRGSKYSMWEGGVRGTAFIWSQLLPLSASMNRVSSNLMHISDWLPTLYAAAGGNVTELGNIDGYNMWSFFHGHSPAPRDHILLNIDPIWNVEGVRKNQYKLLKGSVFNGEFDGWFDKEGRKEENTSFNKQNFDMLYKMYQKQFYGSEVYQVLLNGCEGDYFLSTRNYKKCSTTNCHSITSEEMIRVINDGIQEMHDMQHFLKPVEIHCGPKPYNASTNCLPMKEYCLFDVETDPCEYYNIAYSLPNVREELKELLNKYQQESAPIRNKNPDPMANPRYHDYTFVPWVEDN